MIHMRQFNEFEIKNFTLISNLGIKYTTFQTYWTSLDKRYFDAIAPIRVFFKEEGIHDYASQGQGQINKEYREAYLLTNNLMIPAKASLYRPTTKRVTLVCGFHALANILILMIYLPCFTLMLCYTLLMSLRQMLLNVLTL